MHSGSRRGTCAATAVTAIFALAGALAVRTTVSAAEPPPCTADSAHHCLSLTNGTSQAVFFTIYDSTSGTPAEVGCFGVEAKKTKSYPDVHLSNGAKLTISVYDSTNEKCSPDAYSLVRFTQWVKQPSRYENINYSLG